MGKKKQFVEYHKYKVIKEKKKVRFEEIYPETGQKMVRPKVNLHLAALKVIICVLVNLTAAGIVCQVLQRWVWQVDKTWIINLRYISAFVILTLLAVLFTAKKIVVFVIRLYQRYAAYEVRCTCLFIPNCSEYMVQAINKYGLIKGVKKGFARFNRCKPPHGGVDLP
ncbi:MAG: membrane protein insertion efficiency factor YidD [Clostridia bacterium]|nr:membrane protein insertion efficiency factor YidD [Clostridia bacterium]